MLLALDPSIVSCGVALFRDGRLCAATTIKQGKGAASLSAITRCVVMSQRVAEWALDNALDPIIELCAEWPVIYAPGKGKPAPSKGLPGLSGVATGVAALIARQHPTLKTSCYTPREWTQGTKKEGPNGKLSTWRQSTRYSRVDKRMQGMVEFSIWQAQVKTHDAMDAVGIGLHHLGRFAPVRVYR